MTETLLERQQKTLAWVHGEFLFPPVPKESQRKENLIISYGDRVFIQDARKKTRVYSDLFLTEHRLIVNERQRGYYKKAIFEPRQAE